MIKKLISRRNEDASIFLQGSGKGEIIWTFYYKPTQNCEEIIGLHYFGYIDKGHKNLTSFNLLPEIFLKYYLELRNCYYIKDAYSINIDTKSFIITITKKPDGYTTIGITKDQKTLNKKDWSWTISIGDSELKEYLEELEKIKELVIEEHPNAKAIN
jgi:hypothetical protein